MSILQRIYTLFLGSLLATGCASDEQRIKEATESIKHFMFAVKTGEFSGINAYYEDLGDFSIRRYEQYELKNIEVLEDKAVYAVVEAPTLSHDGICNMFIELYLQKRQGKYKIIASSGLSHFDASTCGQYGKNISGQWRSVRNGFSRDNLIFYHEDSVKAKINNLRDMMTYGGLIMNKRSNLSTFYGIVKGKIIVDNNTPYALPIGKAPFSLSRYTKTNELIESQPLNIKNTIASYSSAAFELPILMNDNFQKYHVTFSGDELDLFYILFFNNAL